MALTAKRVLAALVALMGLGAMAVGLWIAVKIGPKGAATFRATPTTSGAVVITPQVLNRLDADYVVSATAAKAGGKVFLGTAAPTDARLVVGEMSTTTMTGLSVRDNWKIRFTSAGSGELHSVEAADIWRDTASGTGVQKLTVGQDAAPESLVITAEDGKVGLVTIEVDRKAWFVQSIISAVLGLCALLGGVLLWRSRLGTGATSPVRTSVRKPSAGVGVPTVPTPAQDEAVSAPVEAGKAGAESELADADNAGAETELADADNAGAETGAETELADADNAGAEAGAETEQADPATAKGETAEAASAGPENSEDKA